MTDCLNVPYAERHVDPDETGLVAGYTFGEGELAQFGRYLNRARTGAAYDLTTRVGTPLVGQGGGVYSRSGFNAWYNPAAIPVGNTNFAYDLECELYAAVNGYLVGNTTQHFISATAGGLPYISFDAGGTSSVATYSVVGRGPFRASALYDGANQILVINGRQAAADAVVPGAPVNQFHVGSSGPNAVDRLLKVYNIRRTVTQARASYVREFARRVVYQWTPRDVGEGPAGGIPTGAVGEGDWYCPLGGASLAFVWVRDLSVPGGGYLALTDSGALSMRRLDFMHTKMPLFGSWRFRFTLRTPASDNLRFGFIPQRGVDFTAAASGCTWAQVQRAGGVMQATLHLANGAAAYTINHTAAGVAGDVCDLLVTHAVNGDWRAYLAINGVWASNADATVWNDVTQLSSNFVSIAARQVYVSQWTKQAGEMTPGELGA